MNVQIALMLQVDFVQIFFSVFVLPGIYLGVVSMQ